MYSIMKLKLMKIDYLVSFAFHAHPRIIIISNTHNARLLCFFRHYGNIVPRTHPRGACCGKATDYVGVDIA